MPGLGRGTDQPIRARALLERCGIPADGLSDSEAVARAERIVAAVYQRPDLGALWEEHVKDEFVLHDVDATLATMADDPYVHNVPTMVGGVGREGVRTFYTRHMIPKLPGDTQVVPISRTVGTDRVVEELVLSFTHDREIDFMLPGVAATGRRVELPHVVVVKFSGDKIQHEHIWWDQASLLVQVGLLDPAGLPAAGAESARKLLELARRSGPPQSGSSGR